jgi:hypothetical protein
MAPNRRDGLQLQAFGPGSKLGFRPKKGPSTHVLASVTGSFAGPFAAQSRFFFLRAKSVVLTEHAKYLARSVKPRRGGHASLPPGSELT